MKHRPMDFEELDRLFSYDSDTDTGEIRNKVDRGVAGRMVKAGTIATSKNSRGYLVVRFAKNGCNFRHLAHRVAWLLYYGVDPGANEIDHIDQDPTNNRIGNLRLVSHGDNMKNQRKRSDNTSGITGVHWHKGTGKWRAYIHKDGKILHLGLFDDKFEAICVRKSAENRFGYHENHGK